MNLMVSLGRISSSSFHPFPVPPLFLPGLQSARKLASVSGLEESERNGSDGSLIAGRIRNAADKKRGRIHSPPPVVFIRLVTMHSVRVVGGEGGGEREELLIS